MYKQDVVLNNLYVLRYHKIEQSDNYMILK